MAHNLNRRAAGTVLTILLAVGVAATAFVQIRRAGRVEALSAETWTVWVGHGETHVIVAGDGETDLGMTRLRADCSAWTTTAPTTASSIHDGQRRQYRDSDRHPRNPVESI
jgi:hypothetical protein